MSVTQSEQPPEKVFDNADFGLDDDDGSSETGERRRATAVPETRPGGAFTRPTVNARAALDMRVGLPVAVADAYVHSEKARMRAASALFSPERRARIAQAAASAATDAAKLRADVLAAGPEFAPLVRFVEHAIVHIAGKSAHIRPDMERDTDPPLVCECTQMTPAVRLIVGDALSLTLAEPFAAQIDTAHMALGALALMVLMIIAFILIFAL